MKVKTIKLTDSGRSMPGQHLRYKIEQITDSVEFTPGQWLDKSTVEGLCRATDWKVTIVAKK
jgi:hypothetical protein